MANRLLWPNLEPEAIAEGFIAEAPESKITSAQVLDALAYKHTDYNPWNGYPATWVFAREVQRETGVYGDSQRFDGVAIGLVPSVKYARVVYEVKISRGDWLREQRELVEVRYNGHKMSRRTLGYYERLADAAPGDSRAITAGNLDGLRKSGYQVTVGRKWDAALEVSNEFWFAAPPHCILPSELPDGCGLIEVRHFGPARDLRARTVVKAPWRETPHPGPEFWAAVLRRVGRRFDGNFDGKPPE